MRSFHFILLFLILPFVAISQNKSFNLVDSVFTVNSEYRLPILFKNYDTKFGPQFYNNNSSLIDSIIDFMNSNEKLVIEVGYHTSTLGDSSINKKHSLHKAINFIHILKNHGLKSIKLIPLGYGSSNPIVSKKELNQINDKSERQRVDIETNQRLIFKIVETEK